MTNTILKALLLIFKLIAILSGGVMDLIIWLMYASRYGVFTLIIVIGTLPIYLGALVCFFVGMGFSDQIQRELKKNGIYKNLDGIKDVEYYLSYGEKKTN